MCSDTIPAVYKLEKLQPSNQENKELKQRSQESVQRRSLISENHPSQQTSLITNQNSDLQYVATATEPLPKPPASPKHLQDNEESYSSTLTRDLVGSTPSIHSAQIPPQRHEDKPAEVHQKVPHIVHIYINYHKGR